MGFQNITEAGLSPLSASAALESPPADQFVRVCGAKILLVDDNPDNFMLVNKFVSTFGGIVDHAENGFEGVQKVIAESYDLVLMDIQMPVLDGYGALKAIRDHGFKTPIVAFTAHALEAELRRSIEAGFDGFLTKPITRMKLLSFIEDQLRKSA